MLKRYNQFIREFIENSDNILDAKMNELRDLINSVSDGQNMIYEWENKNDHELIVNFTYNNLAITYQFDIDSLYVQKVVGGAVDFHQEVESIDEGLDMIEKDIHMVMGISESYIGQWDSSIKEEDVESILDNIKKCQKRFSRLHEEDLLLHSRKLEKLLRNYDRKTISFIIDLLLYSTPDDNIIEEVINLGDDIMYRYGTEPRMVLNAISDALEYATRFI